MESELDKELEQAIRPLFHGFGVGYKDIEQAKTTFKSIVDRETKKALDWWKEDIVNGFIPKCTRCNRRATEQTTKGKHAQEDNHRPVNWGYYCKKCADAGREEERQAMYG